MQIHDKTFTKFIKRGQIKDRVKALATHIERDYANKNPLLIGVLNGSFMFMADLAKRIQIKSELTFIKVASYEKMASTGEVKELIGLREDIAGRHILLVEDIVDTGNTMAKLIEQLQNSAPASIEVATLLFKPSAIQQDLDLKYVAFEIPNYFVVGYGMDYAGYGRNLRDIYRVKS